MIEQQEQYKLRMANVAQRRNIDPFERNSLDFSQGAKAIFGRSSKAKASAEVEKTTSQLIKEKEELYRRMEEEKGT